MVARQVGGGVISVDGRIFEWLGVHGLPVVVFVIRKSLGPALLWTSFVGIETPHLSLHVPLPAFCVDVRMEGPVFLLQFHRDIRYTTRLGSPPC